MANYDFDLFVIGGGSGGVRVARWSAQLGAKVGICESDRFGGTCVIRGCIPKKFMVMGSHFREEIEMQKAYGWSVGSIGLDWKRFRENRDKEISRLSSLYQGILEKNGVKHLLGTGVVKGPHTVEVDGKAFTAKNIVVAVGGRPSYPTIPGIEHAITSNGVFELERVPQDVVIGGGGYIAVEFAGVFQGFGSNTSIVIRGEKVLRGFDEGARDFLQKEILRKGIRIRNGTTIESIEPRGDRKEVKYSDGSTQEVDVVLCAMGRQPWTQGLGLEEVGVKLKPSGAVVVDAKHQTSVESIYAIGDCTDRVNLTPVALAEGVVLAENLFGGKNREMTYENIASAVFSQPPLATVGLSEEQAKEKYGEIDVYESDFRPLKYTLSEVQERTWMKLIVEKKTQRVVGCHMIGADAPEIVQPLAICLKAGATKADFDATIGIHPTSAEEWVTLRTPRKS